MSIRLHTYTIYSDSGFAPNPYFGYCTLATCKPTIRRDAVVGDWIMATGTEQNVGRNHLVYVMRVEEKMAYDDYYRDPRFVRKIVSDPEVSPDCRGDNMYFIDVHGRWQRAPLSFRHAELWRVRKDLSGRFVLISKDGFRYFGKKAVILPLEYQGLIHTGGGDTAGLHEGKDVVEFLDWVEEMYPPGVFGEPFECITRMSYGKNAEPLLEDLLLLE